MPDTPRVTRVYQNHHLDSTRWDVIVPRADDVIVTTSYKSGTTWAQQIMLELLYGQSDPRPELMEVSPWPDAIRDQIAVFAGKQGAWGWPPEAGKQMNVPNPIYSAAGDD